MTTSTPGPLATPLAWNLVAPGYAEVNIPHFEKYAKDALRLAEVGAKDEVLDVAAGPGSLSILAAAQASRVEAIDFARAMLDRFEARALALGVRNVTAREGDGQALPYADASFDAAFSMFGLMFFPDRAKGFSELRRVLRPGGRAVVASWQPMAQVPLFVSLFEAIAKELPSFPFPDGKGPLSDRGDVHAEMSAAGFRVEVHEASHALSFESFDGAWDDLRKSFAPLVLMEHKMGAEAFAPLAAGIRRRLAEATGSGPVHAEMKAWLGFGRA